MTDLAERPPLPKFHVILYTIAAILTLVGLAEATYLTVASLTGETVLCGGSTSCFQVLGSRFARLGGVPIALLGALAYYTAFSFATFAAFGYARARLFFNLTIGGMFLMTLWLLYAQAFLLHAFCRYCLFSAALVFVLAAIVVLLPRPE
ncbi:MAG TPA: vitamin K epoxide reductase family protein [Chthoniobacterales bacterium]|nr:vitamin K epoxide reductase family protein [Chthoniobacterales bacterium]